MRIDKRIPNRNEIKNWSLWYFVRLQLSLKCPFLKFKLFWAFLACIWNFLAHVIEGRTFIYFVFHESARRNAQLSPQSIITGVDRDIIREQEGVRVYSSTAVEKFWAMPARTARLYGTIRYMTWTHEINFKQIRSDLSDRCLQIFNQNNGLQVKLHENVEICKIT